MGRWAQARRRGSTAPAAASLPAPPAPVLDLDGFDLLQTAQGLDDTGGFLHLWKSPTGSDPWEDFLFDPWEASHAWAGGLLDGNNWYRGTEDGNGVVYAGMSPPSNAIFIP